MNTSNQLLELQKILGKLENLQTSFDYLRITIASPQRIRSWAERILPNNEIVGEVLRSETINFRSHQPETYGLFCEKIFGPLKNWKCKCGCYTGFILNKVCEECHVELVEARVRRYRMGYIDLTSPIAHIWYLKGIPSYLTTILQIVEPQIRTHFLEDIIYFREKKKTELINAENFFLDYTDENLYAEPEVENELTGFIRTTKVPYNPDAYSNWSQKRDGAELLKTVLENIDVKYIIKKKRSWLKKERIKNLNLTEISKLSIRQIRILESFFATKTNLSWMILTVLPVLPPSLRPLLELENGRLVAADINEIYRLILTRNQRLFDFRSLFVPELITLQGRKLLQESVDSLIDNARVPNERKVTLNNKALKSLSEILEGKQGRFRQSLLGKRVDYSARSVIVVGPTLRLNQCGLPYQIGIELFQPFLIHELFKTKIKVHSYNTKLASNIIKKNKPFVWTLLVKLTCKHLVLLNRAPTLHRFGIQAFDPRIVLGQAIHLHPLVCTGFNADFDGDQMAVHLPLYAASQVEIRSLMRPSFNVLSPANGEVILKPTQDMVIGCYYLTLMIAKNKQLLKKWFANEEDALRAFHQKKLNIHSPILVRYKILNLFFEIENQKVKLPGPEHNVLFTNNVLFKNKDIFIFKTFQTSKTFTNGKTILKLYLITNIGILIAYTDLNVTDKYCLTDLLLETTPGRLIFSLNYQKALQFYQNGEENDKSSKKKVPESSEEEIPDSSRKAMEELIKDIVKNISSTNKKNKDKDEKEKIPLRNKIKEQIKDLQKKKKK